MARAANVCLRGHVSRALVRQHGHVATAPLPAAILPNGPWPETGRRLLGTYSGHAIIIIYIQSLCAGDHSNAHDRPWPVSANTRPSSGMLGVVLLPIGALAACCTVKTASPYTSALAAQQVHVSTVNQLTLYPWKTVAFYVAVYVHTRLHANARTMLTFYSPSLP